METDNLVGATPTKEVTFRTLSSEEHYTRDDLHAIFEADGSFVPSPTMSQIDVAEDLAGNLLALQAVQTALHVEPLWVTESERGTSLWRDLYRHLEERFRGSGITLYVFAPSRAHSQMAQSEGFSETGWTVLRKEV